MSQPSESSVRVTPEGGRPEEGHEDPAELALTSLEGVGPARAARLGRLGLYSVRDLLLATPRGLQEQGGGVTAAEAVQAVGSEVSVRGTLRGARIFRRGRRSTTSCEIEDESGRLRVLFFNQPWILERLRERIAAARPVELYGRVVETKSGPALVSPRMGTDERPLPEPGTVIPVYALTDGVGQDFLRDLARDACQRFAGGLSEPLPGIVLEELGLPPLSEAVMELHNPRRRACFQAARRRVAFERLLALQARFQRSRDRASRASARAFVTEHPAGPEAPDAAATRGGDRLGLEPLFALLPHEPTGAQRRVIAEILSDLGRGHPMRRLLQGDVGSGKTLVALAAIARVVRGGGQSALLAPTELLAEQHHLALKPTLERLGVRAELLTASLPASERRARESRLASGASRLAIGTHALFSRLTRFRQLDLAIVDEQQRFGVGQKRALLEKGEGVHLLLMTATPIPRTLALALYGDLEVSLLDELPPGRGKRETRVVLPGDRNRMLSDLSKRMAAGERVFWVCPRIESSSEEAESEASAAAEEAYDGLSRGSLGAFGVELVHGRVEPGERARRLERFRRGAVRLLVATSIVEVGVDVPEATVMVIEGAERFGLAQLHQLRGRVGRGPGTARCYLLGRREAHERLLALERSDDGFALAEEDLRARGMGDLMGTRQAGANVEGLSDPFVDLELVLAARRLVRDDPELMQACLERGAELPPVC